MQNVEFILMLRKGNAKYINNLGSKTLLSVQNTIGHKLHPTEKPVELMEILISNSSNIGDIVLDPFSGSAPVAVACYNLKRKFICIEKDPEYYAISIKRFEQAQRQQFLF